MNSPKLSYSQNISLSDYSLSLTPRSNRISHRAKGMAESKKISKSHTVEGQNDNSPGSSEKVADLVTGKVLVVHANERSSKTHKDSKKLKVRGVVADDVSISPDNSHLKGEQHQVAPEDVVPSYRLRKNKTRGNVVCKQESDLKLESAIASDKLGLGRPTIEDIFFHSGTVSRDTNEFENVSACWPKILEIERLRERFLAAMDVDRLSILPMQFDYVEDPELRQALEQRSFGAMGRGAFIAKYLAEVDRHSGQMTLDEYKQIKWQMAFPNYYKEYSTADIKLSGQKKESEIACADLETKYQKPVHVQFVESIKRLFPHRDLAIRGVESVNSVFPNYVITFHLDDLSFGGCGRDVTFYVSDEKDKGCYVDNGLLKELPIKDRVLKLNLPGGVKHFEWLLKNAVCPINQELIKDYYDFLLIPSVATRDYRSVCWLLERGADPCTIIKVNNFVDFWDKSIKMAMNAAEKRGEEEPRRVLEAMSAEQLLSPETYVYLRTYFDHFADIEKIMYAIDPAILAACDTNVKMVDSKKRAGSFVFGKEIPVDYKILEKLISSGVDLNKCYSAPCFYFEEKNEMAANALGAAIQRNDKELVFFLLEHGSDPTIGFNVKGTGTVSPIGMAVRMELEILGSNLKQRHSHGINMDVTTSGVYKDFIKNIGDPQLPISTLLAQRIGVTSSDELRDILWNEIMQGREVKTKYSKGK